jgi:hypothetical protein
MRMGLSKVCCLASYCYVLSSGPKCGIYTGYTNQDVPVLANRMHSVRYCCFKLSSELIKIFNFLCCDLLAYDTVQSGVLPSVFTKENGAYGFEFLNYSSGAANDSSILEYGAASWGDCLCLQRSIGDL